MGSWLAGVMGWAAMAGAVASGPDAPPPREPAVESDIIVTGERVSRALRDTPSSVVVVPSDMIEAQPDTDRLDTLLEAIPSATRTEFGISRAF